MLFFLNITLVVVYKKATAPLRAQAPQHFGSGLYPLSAMEDNDSDRLPRTRMTVCF